MHGWVSIQLRSVECPQRTRWGQPSYCSLEVSSGQTQLGVRLSDYSIGCPYCALGDPPRPHTVSRPSTLSQQHPFPQQSRRLTLPRHAYPAGNSVSDARSASTSPRFIIFVMYLRGASRGAKVEHAARRAWGSQPRAQAAVLLIIGSRSSAGGSSSIRVAGRAKQ